MSQTVFHFDVLVIGGSGAGVASALAAHKKGAKVGMVVKGKAGNSGNSIMIGGSMSVDGVSAKNLLGLTDANQKYTPQSLFKKLVTSGFMLGDQELQKQFLEEGPKGVKDILDWGKECGSTFAFNSGACRWRTSGISFGRALRHGLKTEGEGITVFEDTMVTDLLTASGKVCGCIGMDVYTGEVLQFLAKSVVLATGGYQPFSLKNSISDMTGDGIAMAFRAGAEIKDMEFLLYIPTIVQPSKYKGSMLPFLMTMHNIFPLVFKATDLDGEELHYPENPRYHPQPENMKVSKLLMSYFYGVGMYKKWDKYGNRFYYDYSAYSDEEIKNGFLHFASFQSQWYGKNRYHHIDLLELAQMVIDNNKRLMVGMGNEYSMGGVSIDSTFATTVPGLFAAGEVSAGLFGAFRSGDGLVEMLANGRVAGESAANYANGKLQETPENAQEAERALLAPLNQKTGESPIALYHELEGICDRGFDFFRDGGRLSEAYARIQGLHARSHEMSAFGPRQYNLELINAQAVRNLCLCAETGIYAALERKESRGCHLREDYPKVDNENFRFSFTAKKEGDAIAYAKSYPKAPFIPLDGKNYDNVAECIVETILEA